MADFQKLYPSETNDRQTADPQSGLQLKPEEVLDLYQRFSAQTDSDKDGFITQREIQYDSPRYRTWEEAMILDSFELYMGDIEELSNDELGDEKKGISQADIETLVRDWNSDGNLDLIRRMNFISQRSLQDRSAMGQAFNTHIADLRNFYAKAGNYTGLMTGAVVGGVLAESSGFLLAAAIPSGLMVGSKCGEELGDTFGRWRGSWVDYDDFARDYVDERLGL